MLASGNGDQLGIVACILERFHQRHALFVRHDRVGVAMQSENGRQSFAHVRDRREAARQLHALGLFGNPGYGVWPLVGPSELVGDVRDSEEIDDGGDLDGGSEIGRRGRHRCHEREVSTGGSAGRDDPLAIHLVLSGVVLEPLRRLQHIVHRCRRRRRLGQPILHIRHHHAAAHERQAILFEHALLVALHPAAAVNDDDAGPVGRATARWAAEYRGPSPR